MDLHLHTPASKDYQQPEVSYLDILQKAETEGLDIIAFTDHNTVAGYAAMTQEISDLERWENGGRATPTEKRRLGEYRRLLSKILVLPGLELTATFGFHILGIFGPETPLRKLEHVLLSLNVPLASLDLGETEVGATSDVLTAYEVLADAGALVIGAHANSSHGVAMMNLDFGGQTRIAYTQDPNLHVLEVTDLEASRRRTTASFFNGSRPQYPRRMHCIQGSDAHRITGNRNNMGVGERATEVLLAELSFGALKDLFLGGDFTRSRPYRRTAEPFDFVEAARSEGPTFVQSFHEQATSQGGRLHAIMRDVAAFANTNGGTIYIGASANLKVAPKGVANAEEAISALRTEIERFVTPPIDIDISVLKSRGQDILRLTVPKGADTPYVLEGSKIYLRQEAETSLAMRDEIVALVSRIPAPRKVSKPDSTPAREKPAPRPEVRAPVSRAPVSQAPAPQEAQPAVEPPRTGVQIVASEERKGITYHTMRDLRDRGDVHNVTRSSARRLWRYAIALKEKGTFGEDKVTWTGGLGVWHKYLRAGRPHYDLVQKLADGTIHVYYGVTEDGIHGLWRAIVGMED